ncbi:MAG: cyclic lactone autoinducer peptide [Hominimerdicola sp.]
MKMQMKAKNLVTGAISKAAVKTAMNSSESACIWIQYQPKEPKALKNIKSK